MGIVSAEQIRLFPKAAPEVILHYYRYYVPHTKEFGTIDSAVQWAAYEVDAGEIFAGHLELADGNRMEHEELDRLIDRELDRGSG